MKYKQVPKMPPQPPTRPSETVKSGTFLCCADGRECLEETSLLKWQKWRKLFQGALRSNGGRTEETGEQSNKVSDTSSSKCSTNLSYFADEAEL